MEPEVIQCNPNPSPNRMKYNVKPDPNLHPHPSLTVTPSMHCIHAQVANVILQLNKDIEEKDIDFL